MKEPALIRFATCLTLLAIMAGTAHADATSPQIATFAGGCFWSMQRHFDSVPGVVRTVVGYTGGPEESPSYEDVSSETTGHAEAVEVFYDPAKTNYEKLLSAYWHYIDPTTLDGQFCDFGHSYRTAIFAHDTDQKRAAEASKEALQKSDRFKGKTIVTEIDDAGPFYAAEEYHQEFYKKNPLHYESYRIGCGRDAALVRIWGDEAGK